MYCVPGEHSGPACGELASGQLVPDRKWRAVRVRLDPKTNEFYYAPDSPATIYVCPLHSVKGEPECN